MGPAPVRCSACATLAGLDPRVPSQEGLARNAVVKLLREKGIEGPFTAGKFHRIDLGAELVIKFEEFFDSAKAQEIIWTSLPGTNFYALKMSGDWKPKKGGELRVLYRPPGPIPLQSYADYPEGEWKVGERVIGEEGTGTLESIELLPLKDMESRVPHEDGGFSKERHWVNPYAGYARFVVRLDSGERRVLDAGSPYGNAQMTDQFVHSSCEGCKVVRRQKRNVGKVILERNRLDIWNPTPKKIETLGRPVNYAGAFLGPEKINVELYEGGMHEAEAFPLSFKGLRQAEHLLANYGIHVHLEFPEGFDPKTWIAEHRGENEYLQENGRATTIEEEAVRKLTGTSSEELLKMNEASKVAKRLGGR